MLQWRRYEAVRSQGEFNMFDPAARISTGMGKGEYIFVMENYSELKEAIELQT
jgi:hypothetical protein